MDTFTNPSTAADFQAIGDAIGLSFWRFHRNNGVSLERMNLHFPSYAKYEEQYQREKGKA